jgi:hypothetical protein
MGRDECIKHAQLCAFQSDAPAYSRPHLTKTKYPSCNSTLYLSHTHNSKLQTAHMAGRRTLSPAHGAATGKHRPAKDADSDEDVAKTESQCVLDHYSNIKPSLTLDFGKSLRSAHF